VTLSGGKPRASGRSAMLRTCSNSSGSCSQASLPGCARARTSSSRTSCCATNSGCWPGPPEPDGMLGCAHGTRALGPGSPMVCQLASPPLLRDARNGRALASTRLAAVLALEVPLSRRTATSQPRDTGPDRDNVAREQAVGHRTDQRRAAQAGHRGEQPFDPALPLAWTRTLTEPIVAHIPEQSRSPPLGD
jgi:hypothetical protein